MKISASIYSNKEKELSTLVAELDKHNIDMLHVDCADDVRVFEDIADVRALSSTPIDLHIISPTPEKYFDKVSELKIEYVSLQFEHLTSIPATPPLPATRFGLSIVSTTALSELDGLDEKGYSFIMLMTTVPGQSGGEFNKENFQRIIEAKQRFPQIDIHVDGGVNDRIACILRLLGVNAMVSGSYLLSHESMGAGLLSFHRAPNGAEKDFQISDFATPVRFLAVLSKGAFSFTDALQAIEDFKLGFALVIDDEERLQGVISNADVRRAMLKHKDNFNSVNADELINTNPISISDSSTLNDMIHLLNELKFILLFLPVIDSEKRLKGAVLLNNLTRV